MYVRKHVAALTAAATFMAGVPTASESAPLPSLPWESAEPVSASEQAVLNNESTAIKGFWNGKGIDLSGMGLVILQRDEAFTCGEGTVQRAMRGDDSDVIRYCWPQNTVVFSQAGIRLLDAIGQRYDMPKSVVYELTSAHEAGHGVEDETQTLAERTGHVESIELELRADCLGGMALRQIDPESAQYAAQFYKAVNFLPDPTHGTYAQRIEQFEIGYQSGQCWPQTTAIATGKTP